MGTKTNWQKNVLVYKIDSFLNWFYVPIGVWVLIWNHFFSFSQISLSMGISLLVGVVCELPSGALADMIGRKKTVIFGRLILFLGYVWLFFRHDFVGFLVWQIAYQIDGAFTSGANSALLYDSLKENGQAEKHYKKVEADTFMYNTIGMAVGGIVGGLLYEITLMGPYNFMVLVAGLGLLASCFYQEPAMEKIGWSIGSYLGQNHKGFMHIFSNSRIRAVSLFSIAVSVVTYTGLWYLYEPRLAAGGFDPKLLAILVSGTYAIRAVGTRFSPTPLLMAISQTMGTALSFIGGKFGAVGSVYLRKFVDGYRQPSLVAWQNDQIESIYRATSLSAISLLTNLIVGGVGPLLGMGIDRFGAEVTLGMWTIFGVLVVIQLGWRLERIMKMN